MATNTGKNFRRAAQKSRSQVPNPKTGLYTKRDKKTGQFIQVKTTGGKFKGVTTES